MNTIVIVLINVVAVVAAVAVTGCIFYKVIKRYFDHQRKESMLQMRIDEHKEAVKTITPIRLQAYERMVLFLERMSPNSLVLRCFKPGMDIRTLQAPMNKQIRDEWEHNLSQQVYLSSESWEKIRGAKDEMINLINASAANLPVEADPSTLAASIFTNIVKTKSPSDEALEYVKAEIKERFE